MFTAEKIQWYLLFYIYSYKHQINFNNSGFSAPDEINISPNLIRYNSMVVVFSPSDYIDIRQNSVIYVFSASDDINIRQNSVISVFSASVDINIR